MLTDIKQKASGIAGSIVVVILAIMVCLGGIQFYSKYNNNSAVAEVNGDEIPESKLKRLIARHKFIQSKIDPSNPLSGKELSEAKENILKMLVSDQASKQYLTKNLMFVPYQFRDAYVRTRPEFQIDGKFNEQKYLEFVTNNFGSEQAYLSNLNDDLLKIQLKTGVTESIFLLPYEIKDLTYLANQVRDFDYLYLDYTKLNVAAITDAEISDYYKNHEQEFFSNDKVSVNYVMISKKDIAKKLNPTDVELESYFLVNSHRYRADDQFKVNIYSVSPETDDSSDSDIGADLVAKLNPKLPVVDMINDGGTVNIEVSSSWKNLHDVKPEIKDQLNKMAAGEIKVVKINGGYNIVELISKRKTELKLNNFRKLVRSDWVNEHAEKKYAAMLDELSDLAYTADSLDEIAKHFGAKVLVSKDFTLDSGADGISKSAFVRNAAFSEDVLENDLNSSVIKLNDNESVVIHLTKKSMAKQRPLSEVKSEIKSILILEKQKEEVEKAANKLVEDLQSEKPIDSFLAQNDVSWKSLKNIRREGIMNRIAMEVKDDVFDMPRPSGSNMSYKSIKLENGNYVVVKLVKVSIANPLILYPSAVHDRYLKEMKETANSSFEYDLRKASKVKYNKAIIEKIN